MNKSILALLALLISGQAFATTPECKKEEAAAVTETEKEEELKAKEDKPVAK